MTLELEAMARAMCLVETPEQNANGCRECLLDHIGGLSDVRLQCANRWGDYVRAALMAIRELGAPVKCFGADVLVEELKSRGSSEIVTEYEIGEAWRAMIDHILGSAE